MSEDKRKVNVEDPDIKPGENEKAEWEEEETYFNSKTSRTTFGKILNGADRLFHKTFEAGKDAAKRGQIELEIASTRMRLKSLYSQIGEAVFRLHEGEEHPDPFGEEELIDLFAQVKATLHDLTRERQKLSDLKGASRSWAQGA